MLYFELSLHDLVNAGLKHDILLGAPNKLSSFGLQTEELFGRFSTQRGVANLHNRSVAMEMAMCCLSANNYASIPLIFKETVIGTVDPDSLDWSNLGEEAHFRREGPINLFVAQVQTSTVPVTDRFLTAFY